MRSNATRRRCARSGVPIEQEVVVGGPYAGSTKYWIDRARYELADLRLEPDEMRALQVAVAATRTGLGPRSGSDVEARLRRDRPRGGSGGDDAVAARPADAARGDRPAGDGRLRVPRGRPHGRTVRAAAARRVLVPRRVRSHARRTADVPRRPHRGADHDGWWRRVRTPARPRPAHGAARRPEAARRRR